MSRKSAERREWWRQAIAEQEKSGQSVRAFCRERTIGEHSFYQWRQRLGEDGKPVAFALVERKPAAPTGKLELTLASGEVLRIPADIDSLRVVFEALREAR